MNRSFNQLMTEISAVFGRETTTAILRSAARQTLGEYPVMADLSITLNGIHLTDFAENLLAQGNVVDQNHLLNASLTAFAQQIYQVIVDLTGSILNATIKMKFVALLQALHPDQRSHSQRR